MTQLFGLTTLLGGLVVSSYADTVKTRSQAEPSGGIEIINGTVTALDETALVIKARFVGEEKSLTLDRSQIKTIEFNSNTFNQGPAKGPFLARPPAHRTTSAPQSRQAEANTDHRRDILYFKEGTQRRSTVISVDTRNIHLRGGEIVGRYLVHSIQLVPR